MRILHLTDIHFYHPPRITELGHLKRLMGSTNLYLLGRKKKFSLQVQRAAIRTGISLKPDLTIITGDLTSMALDSEFALARRELDPLLQSAPAVVIPGNHDMYVEDGTPAAMVEHFSPWIGTGSPHLHEHGEVGALYIETCKPDLLSRGYVPPAELPKATDLLRGKEDLFIFLCLHYPICNRQGMRYGPKQRAIRNPESIEGWLKGTKGIGAVLHGHEHHGYRTEVQTASGPQPSLNPGTSGYAHDRERDRRAHFNLYTVEDRRLSNVERFRYENDTFVPEPGGAYSTGR
jgi:hypothetical protein